MRIVTPEEAVGAAIGYHVATKHHFHAYARSLGYLDWANQPDPFRRFEGAPLHALPFQEVDTSPPFATLYRGGRLEPREVSIETLSEFIINALGLSAWKQHGPSRWALRCNPSSGNLHPTEGYVMIDAMEGLHSNSAVYHYASREHGLERRGECSKGEWQTLTQGFPSHTFFAGLSSIHWREAWKYGERAYRYCQHDVGHALAALAFSAATLGWRCVLLEGMSDDEVASSLGLDRHDAFPPHERECPDLLVAVIPSRGGLSVPSVIPVTHVDAWHGVANRLSGDHVEWHAIDHVDAACRKPATATPPLHLVERSPMSALEGTSARTIIRQRRSAVEMDGRTSMPREVFFAMLHRVMPEVGAVPWETIPWEAAVHLALFVHRVTGLQPGLYCLIRRPDAEESIRRAMDPSFAWRRPEGCPSSLPMFMLAEGDCRDLAKQLSCGQDIAGDGAFSLGMLAEFEPRLRARGAWFYRRLFWETGMIGQTLYLEAEAAGLRATGIGCFFDDPVHRVFGLNDLTYQSLYHFTVGGPVDDPRLATLPPYDHTS